MSLKLWGMLLLALAAAVEMINLSYRFFAHIAACEAEYNCRISRIGTIPGSRRKKSRSECEAEDYPHRTAADGIPETASVQPGGTGPWDDAKTAAMTADIPAGSSDDAEYAETAVMTADVPAAMPGEVQYAETSVMEE